MDGLILKTYIEKQKRPKLHIAKELGMSKQNLYQLFDSENFEVGTIKKIESVFKAKWGAIRASVNIDSNIATKKKEPPNEAENDYRNKYFKLLEEENLRIKKRQAESLDVMREVLLMNQAILKTLRNSVAQLIAKQEKADALEVAHRLDKETAEYYSLAEKGSRI